MKPLLKTITFTLLLGTLTIFSCKKETSCEGCTAKINKPPIAVAGLDQSITLPSDSVLLDGRRSSDPDGRISSYLWTKISGSASFNIIKPSDSITKVKALVPGTYQFELKVTDNGGLYAKDTIVVIVNQAQQNPISCNITMETIAHLPTPGPVGYSASVGTKILFARPSSDNRVDIYDTLTHNWQTVTGMEATGYYLASSKAAVVSNKVIFYSKKNFVGPEQDQVINIYDASSNSWSTNHFSGRGRGFYSMTVVGTKAIYAGGQGIDSNISKTIDVFNASNNSWSVVDFSQGRRGMVTASVDNKVIFAGGYINRYDSLVQVCDDNGSNCSSVPAAAPVNRVDIWDVATNTWSVAQLSEARCFMVTAVVGNKIIFAGGDKLDGGTHSNQIDIYDVVNNSWSSYTVPPTSWFGPCLAYTVGNKVLICNWISDRVDIYDAISNSWSVVHMSEPLIGEQHQYGQVAVSGNKAVFFVQYNRDENNSRNIDIYDASTNTWCHTQLNQLMVRQGIVIYGDKVYIAGGLTMTGCCVYNNSIDTVWHLNY